MPLTPSETRKIYYIITAIAYLCTLATILFVGYGFYYTYTHNNSYIKLIEFILDLNRGGEFFYPLFLSSIFFLWVKSYIKPEPSSTGILFYPSFLISTIIFRIKKFLRIKQNNNPINDK